ncbi:MAG: isoaspartyl peptidase/L-asparaginase [Candidatus Bathyarchaeota archaeon]|jgi:beta-aspartyl-peptidase (threonine type)
MKKPVIAVHGGAGVWRPERRKPGLAGVKKAAATSFKILEADGSALDAVEAAVVCMEDDEVFNAGKGSALTIDGQVEMEASIMDGKSLNAGAVGLLKDIKNPVHLARIVMEHTDHIFVASKASEELAEVFHLEKTEPLTETRIRYWSELKKKLKHEKGIHYLPRLKKLLTSYPNLFETDTVGAVALDIEGDVAAATSTGGLTLKLPGRIGDTPLIGCGIYADNEAGACSTTGIGEVAVKLVLAKATCDYMGHGQQAQEAAESSIKLVNRRIHLRESMGLIAVDMHGGIGAAHNSQHLCWAYMTSEMQKPQAALRAKIVRNTSQAK